MFNVTLTKLFAWSSTQHVDLGLSGHTFQTYCLMINLSSLYLSFDILVIAYHNEFKDDHDIKREIRNLFTRTNILIRRFAKCSAPIQLMLFKT